MRSAAGPRRRLQPLITTLYYRLPDDFSKMDGMIGKRTTVFNDGKEEKYKVRLSENVNRHRHG